MRDSSPPEATLPSGRGVVPAWPATRNSADSRPNDCGASVASSATSNRPPAMPSCCIERVTAAASLGAAARRAAEIRLAACVVGGARRVAGGAQPVEIGGGVERAQLVLPLRSQRSQLGRRPAVAARQPDPGRHPLVDGAQPLRIELGPVEVAGERVRGVAQLRLGAAQRLDRIGEPLVERGDAVERVDRAATSDAHRRRARRRCRRSRPARRCAASSSDWALARRLCSASSSGHSSAPGRELVDLAELPGEPLALALELALLLARRRRGRRGRRARPPRRRRAAGRRPARRRRGWRAPRARASGSARRAGRGCRPAPRRPRAAARRWRRCR